MTRFFRVGRALGARSLGKIQAGEVLEARSFENLQKGSGQKSKQDRQNSLARLNYIWGEGPRSTMTRFFFESEGPREARSLGKIQAGEVPEARSLEN